MCEIRGVEHFSFPGLADGLAYVFAFEIQYAQLAVYFCESWEVRSLWLLMLIVCLIKAKRIVLHTSMQRV